MRIKCKACGKHYDYEKEGCCPECGAYNRPPRRNQVTAAGDVYHISDAAYQDSDTREKTQRGKVCFEQKVCYEDQSYSSTDYARPSAYEDGYVEPEEETTPYEEALEDRFEAAAAASEASFDRAEDRFEEPEEPVHHHGRRSRPHLEDLDAGDLVRQVEDTFHTLTDSLSGGRHKAYTQKTGSRKEGSQVGKTVARIVAVVVILNVVISLVGTLWESFGDEIVGGFGELVPEFVTPTIPEDPETLYEEMDRLDPEEAMSGNQVAYRTVVGQPFVLYDTPVWVSDYGAESADGWSYVVTVSLHVEDDSFIALSMPTLYWRSQGTDEWAYTYDCTYEETAQGAAYVFHFESADENLELMAVFEDYSTPEITEIQVRLQ